MLDWLETIFVRHRDRINERAARRGSASATKLPTASETIPLKNWLLYGLFMLGLTLTIDALTFWLLRFVFPSLEHELALYGLTEMYKGAIIESVLFVIMCLAVNLIAVFDVTAIFFWNRRARRLQSHPSQASLPSSNVWPPPPRIE